MCSEFTLGRTQAPRGGLCDIWCLAKLGTKFLAPRWASFTKPLPQTLHEGVGGGGGGGRQLGQGHMEAASPPEVPAMCRYR